MRISFDIVKKELLQKEETNNTKGEEVKQNLNKLKSIVKIKFM